MSKASVTKTSAKQAVKAVQKPAAKPAAKAITKTVAKAPIKPVEKAAMKPAASPALSAADRKVARQAEKKVEKAAAKVMANHVSKIAANIAANIAAKAAAKEAIKGKNGLSRPAAKVELSESAMTALTMIRTFSPPVQPIEAPDTDSAKAAHKYQVGDAVYFTSPSFGRAAASGTYTVIKVLPFDGEDQQYRIKSSVEAFERVAKESQLERI